MGARGFFIIPLHFYYRQGECHRRRCFRTMTVLRSIFALRLAALFRRSSMTSRLVNTRCPSCPPSLQRLVTVVQRGMPSDHMRDSPHSRFKH